MPTVHKRIADAPHSDVVLVEVDDPYEAGGKIVALRSIRHDILAQMRARGGLDEARYAAGRKFERYCEDAQLTVCAVDPTREPVDGGKYPDPLPDRKATALMALRAAKQKLGQDGYDLTYCVLGRGLTFEQVMPTQWLARRASDHFKDCLEGLALLWGYATCWRRGAFK